MKKLSPDERGHLKAGVGKFRSFSRGKKQAIKNNMRKLRKLPPDKRRERFMGMEWHRDFTPEEKHALYRYFFEIREK